MARPIRSLLSKSESGRVPGSGVGAVESGRRRATYPSGGHREFSVWSPSINANRR
jgi:hypothetical protein